MVLFSRLSAIDHAPGCSAPPAAAYPPCHADDTDVMPYAYER